MKRLCWVTLLAVWGCTGGKSTYHLNEVVQKKDVIKLAVVELNDKVDREKYDFVLQVTNLHSESLVFFLAEMACFKGGKQGSLSHAFFGAGERSIDLKPTQMKEFRLVCSLHQTVPQGNFRISLNRVFENPNNDGKTTGKQVAKDLTLNIKAPGNDNNRA